MEEEDGRPGARALHTGVPGDRFSSLGWLQTGPYDAPGGVFTPSLPPHLFPKNAVILSEDRRLATAVEGPAFHPLNPPKHFRAPSLRFLLVARVGEQESWVSGVSVFASESFEPQDMTPTRKFQIEEKNENVPGK